MTKADRLSRLLTFDPAFKGAWVEYIPGKGWYILASMPRWFGDEGDRIGATYSEAKATIQRITRPNLSNYWTGDR